jgi:hypothetical protein
LENSGERTIAEVAQVPIDLGERVVSSPCYGVAVEIGDGRR